MNAVGLPVLLRGSWGPYFFIKPRKEKMIDSTLIVNDVSATVAGIGFGWTLLGFLSGLVICGAIVYVVSR